MEALHPSVRLRYAGDWQLQEGNVNSGNRIACRAVLIILGAGIANASIVSSNIQPGDVFGPGVAIGIVPFVGVFNYAGIGFTPSQTYTFEDVELAISLSAGPNELAVYLMGDSSGLPSGVIESFDVNGALSTNPSTSLVTIDSVTHPLLQSGTQYWIVAAGGPSTFASWQQNVHNVMGPNVSGPTLASLVRDSNSNVIEAYQVDGAAVVPEPQSWLLVATGAAVLMLCMCRAARLHRFGSRVW
jgi:hypothetical protein